MDRFLISWNKLLGKRKKKIMAEPHQESKPKFQVGVVALELGFCVLGVPAIGNVLIVAF